MHRPHGRHQRLPAAEAALDALPAWLPDQAPRLPAPPALGVLARQHDRRPGPGGDDALHGARRGGAPGGRAREAHRVDAEHRAPRRDAALERRCWPGWRGASASALDAPVVSTLQGEAPFLDSLPESASRGVLEPALGERARELDGLIAVSRYTADADARAPGARSGARCTSCTNGIELDDFGPPPRTPPARADDRLPGAPVRRQGAPDARRRLPAAAAPRARPGRAARRRRRRAGRGPAARRGTARRGPRSAGLAATSSCAPTSRAPRRSRSCRASRSCRCPRPTASPSGSTCSRPWPAACRSSSRATAPSPSSSRRPAAASSASPDDPEALSLALEELLLDPRARARAGTRPAAPPSSATSPPSGWRATSLARLYDDRRTARRRPPRGRLPASTPGRLERSRRSNRLSMAHEFKLRRRVSSPRPTWPASCTSRTSSASWRRPSTPSSARSASRCTRSRGRHGCGAGCACTPTATTSRPARYRDQLEIRLRVRKKSIAVAGLRLRLPPPGPGRRTRRGDRPGRAPTVVHVDPRSARRA